MLPFVVLLFYFSTCIAYQLGQRASQQILKPYQNDEPVVKSFKRPYLTVIDPITRARIHLVGVSHGSSSSANLVKEVFSEVNPAAVVLELCDDRFFSISLDAKIRPRENSTLIDLYDAEMEVIRKEEEEAQSYSAAIGFAAQLSNILKFATQQGVVGGTFVLLGLLVNNLQRLTRSNTGADEFVTAMVEAEKLNIPVRLGDAPQNDTLESIKGIISLELFDPVKVVKGSLFLAFSAFGVLAEKSNKALSNKIPEPLLKASKWVSIPGAYLDDFSMLKSLLPLLLASIVTTFIGTLPLFIEDGVMDIENVNAAISTDPNTALSALAPIQVTTSAIMSYFGALLHDEIGSSKFYTGVASFFEGFNFDAASSIFVDAMSLLFLIRMAKVIGTDRDCIIAKKVQSAASEFPDQDIVVVIGMLHCNGVARWLLSGIDPLDPGY